jgi:flagellar basal-body rod modification protein FlgD
MDFSNALSGQELARTQMQVDAFNKALSNGRVKNNELNKDDFLKILITQLSHQDPTAPMEDKEFISQMAQFSSLEQMTNMSQGFASLSAALSSGQAYSLLGKNVSILEGETMITGMVEAVSGRDFPQVLVNGKYYDFSAVETVTR